MSDGTTDFGKILEQWENESNPSGRGSVSAAPQRFEHWLDKYPPEDKDLQAESETAGAIRTDPAKLKVDDTLDLHGYRLEEALEATGRFIDQAVHNGFHKVVVIHGKGENGQGVLRREVRAFLESHPSTGSMGYNRGIDGGRGALWVIIRQGTKQRIGDSGQRSR